MKAFAAGLFIVLTVSWAKAESLNCYAWEWNEEFVFTKTKLTKDAEHPWYEGETESAQISITYGRGKAIVEIIAKNNTGLAAQSSGEIDSKEKNLRELLKLKFNSQKSVGAGCVFE